MYEESATHEIAETPVANKVLSRRQVVKASAWAAPAVAVALATPAASASGNVTSALTGTAALAYVWNSIGTLTAINGTVPPIRFSGGTGRSSTITPVIFTLTVDGTDVSTATPVLTNSPGWVASAGSVNAGKTVFTFTYGPTLTVPGTTDTAALSFTLAGGTGFAYSTTRAWTAAVSATPTSANTSVSGTSAGGTVTGAPPAPYVSASTPSVQTVGTGANSKSVVVSVTITSNATVTAKLTVTPKHNQDNFAATFPAPGGTITNGTQTNPDVATTVPIAPSVTTITFPTYDKQSANADARPWMLQFFLNGSETAYSTINGTL